jgi:hypothetical protein
MASIFAANLWQPNRELLRQLVSFGAIGAASTLAYVALYAFIRQGSPPAVANAAALTPAPPLPIVLPGAQPFATLSQSK